MVSIDLPPGELSLELQELAGVTLWLSIVPKQRALTLDPNAVGLTVGGERQRPLSYLGPAEPWTSPRAIYQGCGPRIYDLGWSPSKIDVTVDDVRTGNPAKGIRTLPAPPVEIEKEQCFLFFFDVPSSPGHGYAIDLQGLRADGHAVPLPTLTYEAGKVRKWVAAP